MTIDPGAMRLPDDDLVTCLSCGFGWDQVEFIRIATHGGSVVDFANKWRNHPINQSAGAPERDPDLTPLAVLLMDNTEVIDETIDKFGAETVANWFINAGAMIATQYGLTATGKDEQPFAAQEGN